MNDAIKIQCKQLTSENKTVLSNNLRRRITAAEQEIDNIKTTSKAENRDLTDQEKKDVEYLNKRWGELQISYRLVFNTGWILEKRLEYISALKTRIKEFELANKINQAKQDEVKLKDLEKSMRCKKCKQNDMGPMGYIGINEKKGEFSLCSCTNNTMHIIY